MDVETRANLSMTLLDVLRGRLPDGTRWPTGAALANALAAAGRLIDLIVAAPADDSAIAHDRDVAHAAVISAPIDAAQRPGSIPDTPLPRSAPVPPRLVTEIESNAREGEPFQAQVRVRAGDGRAMEILACEVPAAAGVTYESGFLTGTAPRPGEYPLSITCQAADDPQGSPCRVTATLVVNADPRALWKDLPSDRDAAGWKPDTAAVHLPAAHDRQVLLASRRGRSHAHIGALRDDDYGCCVTAADGWNLIAVADGAGSASYSRIGSRIAVDTAVAVARARLLDDQSGPWLRDLAGEDPGAARAAAYHTLGAAAFESSKAIEAQARAQCNDPRDYATTLLLAAHTRTPLGDLVVTYWVGDGAMALYSTEHGVELLGMPQGGDYAGQTQFLDRSVFVDVDQIMQRLSVRIVPGFTALLLMTDGVSDPWFPSDVVLRQSSAWAGFWAEIAPLLAAADPQARALDWLNFWSRGNHDDRTLAVLW
ncbi:PP2C family serine/threonine-protein phosphatase [uncultured Thiodictyon sp.]|uniref:PP2C family serine/threonine-protein phosphatase n=1 Tax=uncultured Thiodictyon sp. TaxID=1846217 RepID=UPI0025F60A0E|nr:PP2C family serine/threonine-protein phosphatase [uncultured Thiodictyon sp.]